MIQWGKREKQKHRSDIGTGKTITRFISDGPSWRSRSIKEEMERYKNRKDITEVISKNFMKFHVLGEELRFFYHPRELRYSITGRNVLSTDLFHRCANSDRNSLPNIGSLVCRRLKQWDLKYRTMRCQKDMQITASIKSTDQKLKQMELK